MKTYGHTVRWVDRKGTVNSVSVSECATPQQALSEALKMARTFGWTPPRWWEFWRWGEPVRRDLTP